MNSTSTSSSASSRVVEFIKECDLFPKVDTTYLERSRQGGIVSLLAFSLISFLCLSELWYFRYAPSTTVQIEADTYLREWIDLTFGMTVMTPCELLIVAIIDEGGQRTVLIDELEREEITIGDGRACRIAGNGIRLNRVNGKMAILPMTGLLPGIMGSLLVAMDPEINFSHQFHHFTFNEDNHNHNNCNNNNSSHPILGQDLNPLKGMKRLDVGRLEHVSYRLSVITTRHYCPKTNAITKEYHEYGVAGITEVPGDHHSLPGIYFEYELEPLSVAVRVDPSVGSWWGLGRKILGIISGVFMCSGLLHHAVNFFFIRIYLPSRNRVIYYGGGLIS